MAMKSLVLNDVVFSDGNNEQVVTSSLKVAEVF